MMVESSPAFTVSEVPIPHVYSVVQKNSCMFEFPTFLLPRPNCHARTTLTKLSRNFFTLSCTNLYLKSQNMLCTKGTIRIGLK